MNPGIPERPEEITTAWLSRALQRAVGEVSVTRIGEDESFTGGGVFRLGLDGGASLIAKLSPAAPALRSAFACANRREVTFYTALSRGLPVPRCAYGDFDIRSGASILLLQDMKGYRAGSFVGGLGADDARALIDALAAVHAHWWERPETAGLQGAALVDEFDFPGLWSRYPGAVSALMPDMVLPAAFVELGDYLAANRKAVFGALMEDGPLTVLHRDCHVDNVMFAGDGAAVLLDWQIMGRGRGICDVAYALISSLPPALRRAEEAALVRRYRDQLARRGVTGYDDDQGWREYRQAVACKIVVSVMATVLLDNSTPAKTAWRRADLGRLLAFCDDHRITPRLFPGGGDDG